MSAPAGETSGKVALALAVLLAAATLVLSIAVIAAGGALRAGLAPWPGIAVIAMAIAAFVLSRDQGSPIVAALLGASGLVELGYAVIATDFLTAVTFPGPVFGIIIGFPLFALAAWLALARAPR